MTEIPRRGRPDVTRVLLADGWHQVEQQTFELDGHSFGFCELVGLQHSGHTAEARYVTGPMSSVLAVESVRSTSPADLSGKPPRPPAWP
jgi:hypothetical protein